MTISDGVTGIMRLHLAALIDHDGIGELHKPESWGYIP